MLKLDFIATMTYSSTIIYISVWLLMTLAFQTVAQENLIPQGPMGTVSYSLVGSVSRVSANVAIEESTVAECGRKCAFRKAIEPQCIGFSWLPKVKLEEVLLGEFYIILNKPPCPKVSRQRSDRYLRYEI